MSISLDIEIESKVVIDDILAILREMKFEYILKNDNEISGNFPKSKIFAVFKRVSNINEMKPRTEGADFARDWEIGVRANFYYVMSKYDECSADMHEFLRKLNNKSDAYFIFSFERERIYAVKDNEGVRFLNEF